ncbi:MAG: hypothetical protein LBV00_08220 [Propionibacteriaceae bacterium]|nr:hypothetical protein [Propionibacteriaceae bacterium]
MKRVLIGIAIGVAGLVVAGSGLVLAWPSAPEPGSEPWLTVPTPSTLTSPSPASSASPASDPSGAQPVSTMQAPPESTTPPDSTGSASSSTEESRDPATVDPAVESVPDTSGTGVDSAETTDATWDPACPGGGVCDGSGAGAGAGTGAGNGAGTGAGSGAGMGHGHGRQVDAPEPGHGRHNG